jgi:hypothetical protein
LKRLAAGAVLAALLAGIIGGESCATACSVPVFRYALERFPSDPYEFVVFHRGPLSAETKQLVAVTESLADDANWPVNLKVRTVDLAAATAEKPAWTPAPDARLPWLVIIPPGGSEETAAWSGPLQADDVQSLVDSPARREVVRRLMKGDSAVFLLVESGRKEADAAVAKLLQTTLANMEKSLQLPTDDGTGGPRSALPLKIAFSTLRVRRDDPAERGLLKILSPTQEKKQDRAEPIVYPIFGRGRILDALSGKALTADTFQEIGEFLCGSCSCSLKGQLPGGDLLMAAPWDAILQGDKLAEESPALQGLGPLARAAADARALAAAGPSVTTAAVDISSTEASTASRHRVLLMALAATLAVIVVLIAAASFVLRSLYRKGGG